MSKCLDKYAAKRILTQRMLKGGSDLEKLRLGSEFWIQPIRKCGILIGEE